MGRKSLFQNRRPLRKQHLLRSAKRKPRKPRKARKSLFQNRIPLRKQHLLRSAKKKAKKSKEEFIPEPDTITEAAPVEERKKESQEKQGRVYSRTGYHYGSSTC